ncbi:MAG: heavy metal-responsive transcriptional regulator [Acidimicrobiales bacterium]
MRIGEVAEVARVPVKTIRYYEQIGLLAEPRRLASSYRDYDGDVVERLQFVRASQALGFTLGEIKGIIAYRDRGEVPCGHVRELIGRRAKEVDERIAELQRMRLVLDGLARRARNLSPEDCMPASVCHLIPRAVRHPR